LVRGFENAFRNIKKEDWDKYLLGEGEANPIKFVKKIIGKKILLIHGDEDKSISLIRTKEYSEKIKDRNDVELKIIPRVGHGKSLRKASSEIILNWLKKNKFENEINNN